MLVMSIVRFSVHFYLTKLLYLGRCCVRECTRESIVAPVTKNTLFCPAIFIGMAEDKFDVHLR